MDEYNFEYDLFLHFSILNKIDFSYFKGMYETTNDKLVECNVVSKYWKNNGEKKENENKKLKKDIKDLKNKNKILNEINQKLLKNENELIEKLKQSENHCKKIKAELNIMSERTENAFKILNQKLAQINDQEKKLETDVSNCNRPINIIQPTAPPLDALYYNN